VPGLKVYTLGYPSSFIEKWAKKEMTLYERGKACLDYLASWNLGKRPIGFVAHSLGGLLVKQMIRTGNGAPDEGWRAIAENTRLVVFLATPHTGSMLASVVNFAFPRLSSTDIALLRSDSSELDQLNAEYRRLVPILHINTAAFYEMHKTKGLAYVVTKKDADPGAFGTEVVAVPADHATICKPKNRLKEVYRGVYRRASEFVANTSTPAKGGAAPTRSSGAAEQLSVYAYGDNVASEIYFVLPFDGKSSFAVPIRFIVRNRSQKSIKNIHVHLEMNDGLYVHELERSLDKISAAREISVITSSGRNEHIARVLYKIPHVPPLSRIVLSDFLFTNEPTVKTIAPGINLVMSLPITMTVDGEDVLPWIGQISVHARAGDINDRLSIKRQQNQLIKEMARRPNGVKPANVTFIGFRKFIRRNVPAARREIIDADLISVVGFNARITPRGLEERSDLSDF
jgi:Putative serine esterase (DUF676)